MKLYRVRYTVDAIVAAGSPQEARQRAVEDFPAVPAAYIPFRPSVRVLAPFNPSYDPLPAGWSLTDAPIGTHLPLVTWVTGGKSGNASAKQGSLTDPYILTDRYLSDWPPKAP